jgi:heme exporter protein D
MIPSFDHYALYIFSAYGFVAICLLAMIISVVYSYKIAKCRGEDHG